ncbi:hypothetical protein B0H66DRAFT_527468 [Apodospora peruviana]|uniref:Uncharacterized protein n=1 Tax=Apodospora peruviana TaxID=516989 RepID=A0AAE0IRT4_9PEZI|nr:hypothetical protein B0H66DRAFT_527468 [Apodospora peruviana]
MMLANPPRQMMGAHSQQAAAAMEMDGTGIDHHNRLVGAQRPQRKRKADNPPEYPERLSKRLSLLNLEQSGAKLYVPVENPGPQTTQPPNLTSSRQQAAPTAEDDSMMQLDDSKYKVYIYNLEDELSSESEAEDGRLVFLPDIEKHMRTNRILPYMLAQPDPDMAQKQLVLYSVPSSISVPEEHDSVRKAIIEARARMREKQKAEMKGSSSASPPQPAPTVAATPHIPVLGDQSVFQSCAPPAEDPDAMELD